MRLFFAVELPDDLTEAVANLQAEFDEAAGLRFTDPEQAHVTMKFLGNVDPEAAGESGESRLADVKRAGAAAVDAYNAGRQTEPEAETAGTVAEGPFEVEVGGLGVFPSPDYISVLWTGVRDGADELTRLHDALETETTNLGFDPGEHGFTPHVTLARMDDPRGKESIQERLEGPSPTVGRFEVSELKLERSELGPEGAEHETVARFPL